MIDTRTGNGREKRQATATDAKVPRRIRTLLVVVVVAGSMLLVGSVAAGSASMAATPDPTASITQDLETDDHDDERVVVRLEDDHVVTESVAGETPRDPYVKTVDSDRPIVVDDGTLVTDNGRNVTVDGRTIRVASTDPNIVMTHPDDPNVVNDTIVVDNSTGLLETADGNETVTASTGQGDEEIWFPHVNRTSFDIDVDRDGIDDIGEGQNLTVPFEVRNTEYGNGTQDINLSLYDSPDDRVISNVSNVSLDRGESATEVLEYETDRNAHETNMIDVLPENGVGDREIPVTINQAETKLTITDVDPPGVGERLSIDVTADRVGNLPQGDHDFLIDFRVGPEEGQTELVETKSVTLTPGGEDTVTFDSYEAQPEDEPEVFVETKLRDGPTANETDDTPVPILGDELIEQNVEATIQRDQVNWPEEGEQLEIPAVIGYIDGEFVPNEPHTFPIELYVDGDLEDSADVTLADGEDTQRETFTYQTEKGDAPRVDVDLESPGEGDSARPRINGSGFDVTIEEIDDPVNETETVTAIARIENVGDADDEQNVRMRIDSAISDPDRVSRDIGDNQTVALEEGEATTERFTYRTDGDDVPQIEVGIITDDAEAMTNVTVRDSAPRFEARELSASSVGNEVDLSATINNTGHEPDNQYVEFHLDDEVVYIDRFSLDPWEERTVSATVDAPTTAGSHDFSVVTDNVTETSGGAVVVDDGDEPEPDEPEPDEPEPDESDTDDDGLPWFLILLGILGVLASAGVLVLYRDDPDNFPPDAATLRSRLNAAVATLKATLGLGTGTLIVQNELPRDTLVRVRCQTSEDTVVLEDLELAPNERRTLGSLPDSSEFKVGAGVEDITAHEEIFQGITGDVGVVLRADGILIANFD